MGSKFGNGYGSIRMPNNGPLVGAHRVAYEVAHGAIPEGMCVLHTCDNPPCCNVEHLFLGTQKDNADDREAKGRGGQKKRPLCKNGHEWTDENTYTNPNTGRRRCRPCGTRYKREWKARTPA